MLVKKSMVIVDLYRAVTFRLWQFMSDLHAIAATH